MSPLTISQLTQLTFDVHILHIFISSDKILYIVKITQLHLLVSVDSICLEIASRNTIIFAYSAQLFDVTLVHSRNGATRRN